MATEPHNYQKSLSVAHRKAFDTFAHALCVIQEQHRMIHDGFFYTASAKLTGWTDATSKRFLLSVPAGVHPHVQVMRLNFGAGNIDFAAYENTTTSNDGTPITARNVNRNSANTPELLLYSEPTITTPGDAIFSLWVPPTSTGTGLSANGVAGVGQGSEWLLKPSTKYQIVLTNNSGGTLTWSYEFSWYEIGYES